MMKIVRVTNYRAMANLTGIILIIIGLAELAPLLCALIVRDVPCIRSFTICSVATLFAGICLHGLIDSKNTRFGSREGYIVVTLVWITASLLGAIPYILSGYAGSFIDAFFESSSGFTTTGCSSMMAAFSSKPLLLWKALTNWMGGMGILVFVISILPALGINGQVIARVETPGPIFEKTTSTIRDSARTLYLTYLTFTAAEFCFLLLSRKMPVFDCLVTTLGSISTGGVLVHPQGIAYYDSFYIEIVISVFCFLSSLNFIIYSRIIKGKISGVLRDREVRGFIIIIAGSVLICSFLLMYSSHTPAKIAFRDSIFQVVSFATTSGYVRSPYTNWPAACQMTLLIIMLIGGCSSSTAGSLKVIRVIVMLKMIFRGSIKKQHPQAAVPIKIGNTAVEAAVVSNITSFVLTFLILLLGSTLVISLQGTDFETSFTSALAIISNTGSAFGHAASVGNFSFYHPLIKLYLSILMIVGRLELFPIIMMFTTNLWGRNR